jgi:hypothetical protein
MPVGVMLLENTHVRGPGSMAHPESYADGALFEPLRGVMGRALVDRPDQVRERVLSTARKLRDRGADVITMNCGFGVLFQRDLVAATGVTIVSSSLLLLPTLAVVHGGKVGVVTFDKRALGPEHLAAAGWPTGVPLAVADVQRFAEWRLLDEEDPVDLRLEAMGSQLRQTARQLVDDHALTALVLECSGMVPFVPTLEAQLSNLASQPSRFPSRLGAPVGCRVHSIFDALILVSRGRNAA